MFSLKPAFPFRSDGVGEAANDHGRSTAEALAAIGKDFARLRRLSFVGAFLNHSGARELRETGFISVWSMCALVSFPTAKDLDEDTAKKWLDGMEAIQKSLHAMENAQLDGVSKCGVAGIIAGFLLSISILLSTLGLVIGGYPGWLAVLLFLAAASTYAVLSLRMEASLKRPVKAISDGLRATCDKLPSCLWNDIHGEPT